MVDAAATLCEVAANLNFVCWIAADEALVANILNMMDGSFIDWLRRDTIDSNDDVAIDISNDLLGGDETN